MCEIGAIIQKDEQYIRGWLRLYEKTATRQQLEEALRYIMATQKHHREHMDRCEECAIAYEAKYPSRPSEAA